MDRDLCKFLESVSLPGFAKRALHVSMCVWVCVWVWVGVYMLGHAFHDPAGSLQLCLSAHFQPVQSHGQKELRF